MWISPTGMDTWTGCGEKDGRCLDVGLDRADPSQAPLLIEHTSAVYSERAIARNPRQHSAEVPAPIPAPFLTPVLAPALQPA